MDYIRKLTYSYTDATQYAEVDLESHDVVDAEYARRDGERQQEQKVQRSAPIAHDIEVMQSQIPADDAQQERDKAVLL